MLGWNGFNRDQSGIANSAVATLGKDLHLDLSLFPFALLERFQLVWLKLILENGDPKSFARVHIEHSDAETRTGPARIHREYAENRIDTLMLDSRESCSGTICSSPNFLSVDEETVRVVETLQPFFLDSGLISLEFVTLHISIEETGKDLQTGCDSHMAMIGIMQQLPGLRMG